MPGSSQRDAVLEIVRGSPDHPTAAAVYRRARRRIPRISLGTVYRNLRRLAASGAIREIHAGGMPVRFDGNLAPHDHVRCLGCGTIADLPPTGGGREHEALARARNFRVLGSHVEVQGLCPRCASRTLGARAPGPQRTLKEEQ